MPKLKIMVLIPLSSLIALKNMLKALCLRLVKWLAIWLEYYAANTFLQLIPHLWTDNISAYSGRHIHVYIIIYLLMTMLIVTNLTATIGSCLIKM